MKQRWTMVGLVVLVLSAGLGALTGLEGAVMPIGILTAFLVVTTLSLFLRGGGPSSTRTGPSVATPEEDMKVATLEGMLGLITLAVSARILLAVVLNSTSLAIQLAPDSYGYYYYGRAIAGAWKYGRVDPRAMAGYQPLSFYQQLNAVTAYAFGAGTPLVLSVVNAFVGTWAAWIVSRMSLELYGAKAARVTFLLAAFCPSILLWTSLNLRDSWNFVAVMGAVLAMQRMRMSFKLKHLLVFLACILFIPFLRTYMLALVALGVGLSFFVVRPRQVPVALVGVFVLVTVLTTLAGSFDVDTRLDPAHHLETMQVMKEGMSSGAGASYHRDADISTPAAALAYLPLGTVYFLFTPFPWTVSKPRQLVAALETLAWLAIFIAGARMLWRDVKARFTRVVLPLSVCTVVTAAYSLVEGNEGTAYRHRALTMLFFFVWAAGYWVTRERERTRLA